MISLCQLDRRWSSNYLGRSRASIGRFGCTTTAICMLISKFTNDFPTPDQAARKFSYVASGSAGGSILWTSDFRPLKFVKRGYNNNRGEIALYANSPKQGVIIAVNNNAHWLVVDEVKNGVVYVYDPINFNGRERLSARYTISGYALFESEIPVAQDILDDNTIPEYGTEAVEWAKSNGYATHWDTPHRAISEEEIEIIFKRLGAFEREPLTGKVSKLDFVLGLYRLLNKK